MDKYVVNNYIVQMRQSVTQARVQTLNKLVREIRKLQNKKGTDEQKEKNCRKAERLTQEVILMKKLDPDKLSKYALLCTADATEMLNKVSLSVEERAKVRLAAHKSVIHQVEIFRAKYPEWSLKLPPLLVQLGIQFKYKKNKSVNQGSNSVTTISSVTSRSVKPKGRTEIENKSVKESSSSSNSKVDMLSDRRTNDKLKGKCEKVNKTVRDSNNSVPHIPGDLKNSGKTNKREKENKMMLRSSEFKTADETSESKSNVKKSCTNILSATLNCQKEHKVANNEMIVLSDMCERKKKVNGIAEVCRFAELVDEKFEIEPPTVQDDNLNPTNTVPDPFFLTGDDSGESEVEMNSTEDEAKDSDSNRDHFFVKSSYKKLGKTKIREKGRDWNLENRSSSSRQRYFKSDQKVPTMNRKQRRMMEKARLEMKKDSAFSKAGGSFPKCLESFNKRKFSLNPDINIGSAPEKQEILHPSWEAKRKQKEQILPFQGKKIKFEDD